jgi:protein-disulfide isomerase
MPDAPDLTLPVGERDHIQGAGGAPVTLVEYGDYECPHCGHAYPIVQEVQRRLGEKLRFVFRNFPITGTHPHAEVAAEAAELAAAQGKFWEMHDALFEHQTALGEASILALAAEVGMDTRKLGAGLESGAARDRVREDFMSGVRSGVNGTPTFFINGMRYDDSWDTETLTEALEAAALRRHEAAG